MSQDLNALVNQKIKEEEERSVMGHDLYEIRDQLPAIQINEENRQHYYSLLTAYINIANQFGEDICGLFAELTIIYDLNDIEDLKDADKEALRIVFLVLRGQLAHSMMQANNAMDYINNIESFELSGLLGKDYYLIAVTLQNLYYSYATLINYMHHRRYFNEEFIVGVRERMMFLISPAMEELRIMFKVIECYELKRSIEFGLSKHLH